MTGKATELSNIFYQEFSDFSRLYWPFNNVKLQTFYLILLLVSKRKKKTGNKIAGIKYTYKERERQGLSLL